MAGASVTVKSYRKERETEIMGGLQKALEKVGAVVERQAKENVTQSGSKHPQVVTGRLRASIIHQVTSDGVQIVAEIGSNVTYSKDLEFGHTQKAGRYVPAIGARLVAEDVPAYPWLYPAIEQNRNNIVAILKGKEFTIG